jgi:hypothetical protein
MLIDHAANDPIFLDLTSRALVAVGINGPPSQTFMKQLDQFASDNDTGPMYWSDKKGASVGDKVGDYRLPACPHSSEPPPAETPVGCKSSDN